MLSDAVHSYAAAPMVRPEPDAWRGAVVLGSHRSGTSAVTGMIDALGLPACREEDRFRVRARGFHELYESMSLSFFDDGLLTKLGGGWWAPPLLPAGWESSPDLEDAKGEAALLFAAAHPAARWVWKDPRACVLMPFWDTILGTDCPRIIVLRNPLECADSLAARNQMPRELSLAMTERNLRTALRDSEGRAVQVTAYEDLLADPARWCTETSMFLERNGLSLDKALPVDRATALLKASMRHHREDDADLRAPAAPGQLHRLWTWALERRGTHEVFAVEGLPDESRGTAEVLAEAYEKFVPVEEGLVRPPR